MLTKISSAELVPGNLIDVGLTQVGGRLKTAVLQLPTGAQIDEIQKKIDKQIKLEIVTRSMLLTSYFEHKKQAGPPLKIKEWLPLSDEDPERVFLSIPLCRKIEPDRFQFLEGVDLVPALLQVIKLRGVVVLSEK
ncbi:hypothetical protein [Rhodoferax mekongensis]|uniref:Uncharacterized protein n=1 Tax=Rhodoferax mekongensis TaxID=3068341 RepID=A0ABZ0AYW3_9BURK|nr:hypothetical protein [Rhodoferax sp. TBRC 17307]WNO03934.1 hypothetical protein RAN89_13565 [Rhodoferax sp. TBRC 17307]